MTGGSTQVAAPAAPEPVPEVVTSAATFHPKLLLEQEDGRLRSSRVL